jgi:hypothetical protein
MPDPSGTAAKCTHESLRFDGVGTYVLLCNDCPARWHAVDAQDQQRFEAIFESHGVVPTRQSPFYIRPLPLPKPRNPARR